MEQSGGPSPKAWARAKRIRNHGKSPAFVTALNIVKICWLTPAVFPFRIWRVFHVKISCPLWLIYCLLSFIFCQFSNKWYQSWFQIRVSRWHRRSMICRRWTTRRGSRYGKSRCKLFWRNLRILMRHWKASGRRRRMSGPLRKRGEIVRPCP